MVPTNGIESPWSWLAWSKYVPVPEPITCQRIWCSDWPDSVMWCPQTEGMRLATPEEELRVDSGGVMPQKENWVLSSDMGMNAGPAYPLHLESFLWRPNIHQSFPLPLPSLPLFVGHSPPLTGRPSLYILPSFKWTSRPRWSLPYSIVVSYNETVPLYSKNLTRAHQHSVP